MNSLDIDPANLKQEFTGDWLKFRDSRARKFLAAWAELQLHNTHLRLETATGEEVSKAQGANTEIRKLLSILERSSVEESLKEVVDFLERK